MTIAVDWDVKHQTTKPMICTCFLLTAGDEVHEFNIRIRTRVTGTGTDRKSHSETNYGRSLEYREELPGPATREIRGKWHLLLLSAEMFNKPHGQTELTQIRLFLPLSY